MAPVVHRPARAGKKSRPNDAPSRWRRAGEHQGTVRFGMKLVDGTILGPDALDRLWTPPDALSRYALGWDTGRDACQRVVAKNGGQLGSNSYIRIYPDAGIVIAVLTNRQSGGHSAVTLGRGIGGILLEEVCR
jgi:CubicO group peptidase (beta-lactamase class C family)